MANGKRKASEGPESMSICVGSTSHSIANEVRVADSIQVAPATITSAPVETAVYESIAVATTSASGGQEQSREGPQIVETSESPASIKDEATAESTVKTPDKNAGTPEKRGPGRPRREHKAGEAAISSKFILDKSTAEFTFKVEHYCNCNCKICQEQSRKKPQSEEGAESSTSDSESTREPVNYDESTDDEISVQSSKASRVKAAPNAGTTEYRGRGRPRTTDKRPEKKTKIKRPSPEAVNPPSPEAVYPPSPEVVDQPYQNFTFWPGRSYPLVLLKFAGVQSKDFTLHLPSKTEELSSEAALAMHRATYPEDWPNCNNTASYEALPTPSGFGSTNIDNVKLKGIECLFGSTKIDDAVLMKDPLPRSERRKVPEMDEEMAQIEKTRIERFMALLKQKMGPSTTMACIEGAKPIRVPMPRV